MAIDPVTLPKITLFDGLTASELALVADNSRERSYKTGITVVSQEEPGETFYVILHGTVRICTPLPDGNQVFLALLGTGDTVGEMSLIDRKGRSADVVTQEPTSLLTIGRTAFDELMTNGSTFPRNLMRILARRLRLANVRLQAKCTLDVLGMVAFQIIEFADLYGEKKPSGRIDIPIRLTQQDIADLVGASRERVNQVMVFYRSKNYIAVDSRYRISVLDMEGLRKHLLQNN